MNESTLESFLLFCDEMMIADEGMASIENKVKKIFDSIKRSFRNINTWCKNALRDINYFKEAQIDAEMNKDLERVLKTSQPRTELNFGPIRLYYKIISLTGKTDMKVNRMVVGEVYEKSGYKENFEDLVSRSSIDTMEALDAAKKSEEYKRLIANDYSNEKLDKIPVGKITEDINHTNNMATSFGNQVEAIESKSKNKSKDINDMRNKMLHFCKTVVNYCVFRIKVLAKYLESAKASLAGTVKNFVASKVKDHRSDLKYHIPKITKTVKLEEYDTFKEHVEVMKTTDDYSKYKESFEYVTNKVGIKDHVIKQLKLNDTLQEAFVMAVKDDGDDIDTSNSKLYHVSDNPNLTELIPFFRSKSGTTFFPTPRIYVHLNVPLNRLGSTVQHSTEKGDTVVYRVSQKVSKAYVDREIGKTAVYIESEHPIKIKKIDYNRWKGQMNFKVKSKIDERDGN